MQADYVGKCEDEAMGLTTYEITKVVTYKATVMARDYSEAREIADDLSYRDMDVEDVDIDIT